VAQLLKLDESKLSTFQPSGKKRYFEEVVDQLNLEGDEGRKAKRKLQDKVGLAELMMGGWTNATQIPAYVDALLDLIERSRLA
jgi:hypothetical protein